MAGGRPTKYSKAMVASAQQYIALCEDEVSGRVRKVNLPTIEGLALHLGVSRDSIHEWRKRYPEFSDLSREPVSQAVCRAHQQRAGRVLQPKDREGSAR